MDGQDALKRRVAELELQLARLQQTNATLQDEHSRIVEALKLSEERFSKAFYATPDALNISRLSDYVHVAVNPGFTALTGYSEQEVVGRSAREINLWADRADRERMVQQLREKGTVDNLEAQFRSKDGTLRWAVMNSRIIHIAGEACVLSITRDVSETRRAQRERDAMQQRLQAVERTEALGMLAGGIAHDFNNLLTPILGAASLLLGDERLPRKARDEAAAIMDAGERAADLTRQILAYSRKQLLNLELLDLNCEISRTERMLRRVIGEDVRIQLELAPGLPAVSADASQMQQILLNLAVNARDAMPGGGKIILKTATFTPDQPIRAARGLREGLHVLLEVSDTGSGMSEETLQRAFDPFFTTKGPGKGTGMGLATVRGIAEQHGGAIWAESAPGKGSTFIVCLPAAQGAAAEKSKQAARRCKGKELVLVADDDAAVREAVKRLLESDGYRVIAAKDAAQALAVVEQLGKAPDLLITDVVMPEMDGRELRDRVAHRYPRLKTLFMSGHAENVLAPHGALDEGLRLIHKPFAAAALSSAVRAALDET